MRSTIRRSALAVLTSGATAVALLTLGGCSGTSGADASDPTVQPADTWSDAPSDPASELDQLASGPSASPTSTTNAHGNLVKAVGDDAGITIDGANAADWVVTKIAVDPPCHNRYAQKPANGHFVVVTLKVTTTAALLNDDGSPGSVTFSEGIWSGYDSRGTKFNDVLGNGYSCLTDAERLPDQIGPGQTATGKLAFDVTSPHGSLELPQLVAPGGWEYHYPQ